MLLSLPSHFPFIKWPPGLGWPDKLLLLFSYKSIKGRNNLKKFSGYVILFSIRILGSFQKKTVKLLLILKNKILFLSVFIVLRDNGIISLFLHVIFIFLPFQFCCCVKFNPLPQISVYGQDFPSLWNSSSELKPEMINSFDLGPCGLSISLTAVGILLRTGFALAQKECSGTSSQCQSLPYICIIWSFAVTCCLIRANSQYKSDILSLKLVEAPL